MDDAPLSRTPFQAPRCFAESNNIQDNSFQGPRIAERVFMDMSAECSMFPCVGYVTQRVHLDCHYGLRVQKQCHICFVGPSSIMALYLDPLGNIRHLMLLCALSGAWPWRFFFFFFFFFSGLPLRVQVPTCEVCTPNHNYDSYYRNHI